MKKLYLYKMKAKVLAQIVLLFVLMAYGPWAKAQTYCTPTFTNSGTYYSGMQTVTMGSLVNNSGATNMAVTYTDYSNTHAAAYVPGATVNFSILVGSGGSATRVAIYIDWNKDFSFDQTEKLAESASQNAGTTYAGTFQVPANQSPGAYKMRITGDLGSQAANNPCALQYTGEVEDYSFIVLNSNLDIASISAPTSLVIGNNAIAFSFYNFTAGTTITSADIGYSVNSGTPVTQTLTGLTLAPGAGMTPTFNTPLNISTPGIYTLKVWARNPNAQGAGIATNDTITRVIQACYPLNGTYTINANGSGGSNYTTFAAAVQDLSICGISGPVTFQVASGTFNEQIRIPLISGVSSTNTIKFIGAGKGATILTSAAQTTSARYTLLFDGASRVSFRDMTIRSTNGSFGWTIQYMGSSGVNNINLTNLNIECAGGGTNATGTAFIPVVFSNSATSYTTAVLAYENTIDSCLLDGGYIGLDFYGNTTGNANFGNYFRYNTIQNVYYYGVYANYLQELKFIGNTINMRVTGTTAAASQGMYIINSNNSYPLLHEILNNRIYNCGQYGIYMSSVSGSTGSRGIMANNFIGGDFRNTASIYAVSLNSCNWWNIYNNSININSNTTGDAIGLYINNGANQFNIDARNNMIQVTGTGGSPLALWAASSTVFSDLDYNNYFVKNGANLIALGSTYGTTNFKGVANFNRNSFSIESPYASSTNLRHTNGCLTGIQLSQITKDIDGDTRTSTPKIGADEFTNTSVDDIGILSVVSPVGQVSTGLQNLVVRLKNFGTNTITSAQIYYTHNNNGPISVSWSGTLLPCGEVDVTFAGSSGVTIVTGMNAITVYTTNPNGNTDTYAGNDATQARVCPPMNGNFTIDPSSNAAGNFKSFTEATDALMCAGLNGPIHFTVAAGTYVEQISLRGVVGVSATNTITFDGGVGNAATRMLTFNNAQTGTRHTFLLEDMKHVTIKNITILGQSTSFGWPLHIFGSLSENIKVVNCRIGFIGAQATSTSSSFIPVVLNNSKTQESATGTFKDIIIDSCQILGGYYGMYIYGNGAANTGNRISNNSFLETYYYGLYVYNTNAYEVSNNNFKMRLGNANSYAIQMQSINATGVLFTKISNNRMFNMGRYGIYLSSVDNLATNRGEMFNNMIGGGFSSGTAQGIYFTSCDGWNIFHNTVDVDYLQTNTGGSSTAFYTTSCTQFDIRNNIFSLSHPSLNNASIFPVYMNNAITGLVCDYNNYYKAGTTTNFVRINGINYTAASYKTGGGFNTNSSFQLPEFVGATDLHIVNGCNIAPRLNAVQSDYDGEARQANTTLGADEGKLLDAAIGKITAPGTTVITGTQDISYTVRNTGKTSITSFTASYTVNGVNRVDQPWTGTLAPCNSVTVLFTGAQAATIPSGGAITISAFISNVNGGNDDNQKNDSTSNAYCNGPLSGTYTVDPNSAATRNFPSIATVMSILTSCGMNGDVTFKFGEGTFTGQIALDTISIPSLVHHRITFEGVDSAKSIITNNGGGYTVRLNGVDYTTFRKLGIVNTAITNAFTVHLTNGSDSNLFENCFISSPSVSNTTVITFGIMGATYNQTGAIWGQHNLVQNSRLEGGYWTVNNYGSGSTNLLSDGNKYRNNQILNGYNYAVYNYYQINPEYTGNTLSAPATASGVIYFTYGAQIKVERNYIYGASNYGIYMNYCSPNANFTRGSIRNNIIGGQYTTGQAMCIYNINTFNIDFQHNSMLTSKTGATSYTFFNSSGSGNTLLNNIIATETDNGGIAMYLATQNSFTRVDYNNLYTTSTTLAYTWGTNHFDLAGLKTSNATFNQNSVSVKPNFVNTNAIDPDLHINDLVPAPIGDNTLGVNIDIDNDARCPSAKTIGADESKYIDPVSIRFTVSDTVFVNSPFTAINADIPGSSRSYAWDFGNDGSIEATTFHATYSFATTGLKQIKLKSSSCNGSDSMILSLVVVAPTKVPVADFISDKYAVAPFETVTLQDLSTNGPTSWTWDITPNTNGLVFYDAFAQNPEVLFGEPGVYEICLIADNALGSSTQKCKTAYITVKDVNNMCIGNLSSSAVAGEIYDSGGPTAAYGNNENCTFLIEPCASSVNLKFTQFTTANAAHFLRVYDGKDINGTLLGTFSSSSGLPGGTNGLTANSGSMFLVWSTSATGTAAGFGATWTSVPNTSNTLVGGFDVPDSAYILETVNFINTTTGSGVTYSWDLDNDGFEDAVTPDVEFIYTLDGTYFPRLTVRDACGNVQIIDDTLVVTTPTTPPVADFKADARVVTVGDTVRFTDLSTNGPISWSYTITPSTNAVVGGTGKNPFVIFTDTGWYSVTLDADNAAGTGSVTKTNYIRVLTYCTPTVDGLVPDIGINTVKFSTLENSSASGVQGFTSYFNNTSVSPAIVDAGGTYEIQVGRTTTLNKMNRKVWIDYNADGDFADAGELVASEAAANTAQWSVNVTIPVSAVRGTTRMRVGTAFNDSTNVACGPNFFGEVEEYRVIINEDITPPVITLVGASIEIIELGQTYVDLGATAMDAVDGNLTASIITTNNLNVNVAGTYYYYYNVSDAAGNAAVQVEREIRVMPDITPPVLQLNTPLVVTVPLLSTFVETGYSAIDAISGNVTANVLVDRSAFDSTVIGTYSIRYVAYDAAGNTDTAWRTVHVIDNIAPSITLNGVTPMEVEVNTTFSDPGVSVSDNYDLIVNAIITSNVNVNAVGSYTILYQAKDASNNISNVSRIVNVVDKTAPVLQLANTDTIVVEVFGDIVFPASSATDNYDTDPEIMFGGFWDVDVLGVYTLDFYAEDVYGNQSPIQKIVVKVVDTEAPVITLNGSYLITVQRWSNFIDPGVTIDDNYYSGLTATLGGSFVNTSSEGLYSITYDVTDSSGNVATQVTRAVNVVASLTSLDEKEEASFNMYPNPAVNSVTLEFEGTTELAQEVRIVSSLGQVVLVKSVETGLGQVSLDVEKLMPGVYYVQVIQGGTTSLKKLVIAK